MPPARSAAQASSSEVLVDGRYLLLDRVGSGATADVYCAHDLRLWRKVAPKVLHHRRADDAETVERFRR
jgi:serine/threonine protein kinase